MKDRIKRHYRSITNTSLLLLIRLDYYKEQKHILSLKHILLNEYLPNTNRGVWIIFHLQRNLLNQMKNDVLFVHCNNNMIDDLNEEMLINKEIFLHASYSHLALQFRNYLSQTVFEQLVDRCLSKFRYTMTDDEEINLRRQRIIQSLISPLDKTRNLSLRSIVEEHLFILIERLDNHPNQCLKDWRLDLLKNGMLIGSSRSFHQALQLALAQFSEKHLFLTLLFGIILMEQFAKI